jgi:hypothetical protein
MDDHPMAELLAGLLDLTPAGSPPHPPGACAALCVPTCCAEPGPAADRTHEAEPVVAAAGAGPR